MFSRSHARREEARFADACSEAGVSLGTGADFTVESDALFYRLAESGWLGLGESYMAGEWHATDLPTVIRRLISVAYLPKRKLRTSADDGDALGIPPDLRRLAAGEHASLQTGIFNTGIPTVTQPEPGVSTRTYSAPGNVVPADIVEAQQRAFAILCADIDIRSGDFVGEFGYNGAALSEVAAEMGARVEYSSADALNVEKVRAAHLPGVSVARTPFPIPGERVRQRRYTAVVSNDYANVVPEAEFSAFLRWGGGNLSPAGAMGIGALVRTGDHAIIDHVLQATRRYLAPTLRLPEATRLGALVTRNSGLPVRSTTVIDTHVAPSFRIFYGNFDSAESEAGALGFDSCYRNLFRFTLAGITALASCEMIGARQIVAGR
ncbi:MAG: cyclopropane-fatty-acyl-phospholipid synthase [Corynebacterium glucuronolyticum]|nr:cyclopropane-fatty-acyl-phospholipid synthase [Corynebacterium glucuronolyticum]MDD7587175.1 cyclopropane-fatty-acyl-phospholipid synthase [Mycobacteriaceae bacterium]MDY5834232.1 cyclopropane-fatty-acyl-phospholipid synthase [Corynebacterium glucuronolyticum]